MMIINEEVTDYKIETNFFGRVRNLSLPATSYNSLVPLFEAIMNAIQAIEDKHGPKNLNQGSVVINILRNPKSNDVVGFSVADDGIGLNTENFKSFLTSDSDYKISRGGKGVGRLSWLKTFKNVHVASVTSNADGDFRLEFDFRLDKETQIKNFQFEKLEKKPAVTGTIVNLEPYESKYQNSCPKKLETIANKIIGHFLSFFVNYNVPKITISDNANSLDLNDYSKEIKDEEVEFEISIEEDGETKLFALNCFHIPKNFADDERGNNAVYYIANGRSVRRVSLDTPLGLSVIGENQVYCGCLTGKYCDENANQERTKFNWSDDFFKELNSIVIEKSKEYLSSEIENVRTVQRDKILDIAKEHPRFHSIAQDPDAYADSLPLNIQSRENLYLEMTRSNLRAYKTKRRAYTKALKNNVDIENTARAYSKELSGESLNLLAECMWKRKLILDLLDTRMEYVDEAHSKKALEESVHEIICPVRATSDTLGYEDHNLWIIDDALAYYSYFGSDVTIKKITNSTIPASERPDIIVFDDSLGFQYPSSDQPVTIVEFKRPDRDDYTLEHNPITQVRNYVEAIRRQKAIKNVRGREIQEVDDDTNFMCQIVADITPSLIATMKAFGPFHKRKNKNTYYKWDDDYKTFIQISSYKDVLDSAKMRHEFFFDKLGIGR